MAQNVHLAPLWPVAAGALGLVVLNAVEALSMAGWIAALVYLLVSNMLLSRGLRRSGSVRFGPANAVTAGRSTLVALVTAMVVTSFTQPVSVPLLVGSAAVALSLDAVDGWIARRTGTTTELGARFDMEVDAYLLLVLSAYVGAHVGWWALAIGLLRYVFVAAGWIMPWMRATLPPRYWRKVVTAVAGIALVVAASGIGPAWLAVVATLVALDLLLESFGRDVTWLAVRRPVARRRTRVKWNTTASSPRGLSH
jgi:phosphatidylglycerophosphate synthase